MAGHEVGRAAQPSEFALAATQADPAVTVAADVAALLRTDRIDPADPALARCVVTALGITNSAVRLYDGGVGIWCNSASAESAAGFKRSGVGEGVLSESSDHARSLARGRTGQLTLCRQWAVAERPGDHGEGNSPLTPLDWGRSCLIPS